MVVGRIHFRSLDGVGDFRREVLDPVHSALEGSKALQILVLARGHKIPRSPGLAHKSRRSDRPCRGPMTLAADGRESIVRIRRPQARSLSLAATETSENAWRRRLGHT